MSRCEFSAGLPPSADEFPHVGHKIWFQVACYVCSRDRLLGLNLELSAVTLGDCKCGDSKALLSAPTQKVIYCNLL